jgi:hypothetical protein
MVTQVCSLLGQALLLCYYLAFVLWSIVRQTLALLHVLDVLVVKALQLSYALALLWKFVVGWTIVLMLLKFVFPVVLHLGWHSAIAVAFILRLLTLFICMTGCKKCLGSFRSGLRVP